MSESNEPDIMYHGAEWFEKNKGKLLYGALAVIIAAGGIQFYWKNTAQTKAASESALFAIQYRDATNLEDIAGAYGTVSTDQAGKPVAERALILSAKTWLEAADYDKAQAAFKSLASLMGSKMCIMGKTCQGYAAQKPVYGEK